MRKDEEKKQETGQEPSVQQQHQHPVGEHFHVNSPRTPRHVISTHRDDDLVGVHNLGARNIPKLAELGGIASPSIAIVKRKHGHDDYGPISLVASSDLVDPQKTPVFAGDVYSPMHPRDRSLHFRQSLHTAYHYEHPGDKDLGYYPDSESHQKLEEKIKNKDPKIEKALQNLYAKREDKYTSIDYDSWREKFVKEAFTPHFEDDDETLVDFNLPNIVKKMTRNGARPEVTKHTIGLMHAATIRQFRDSDDMKRHAHKLKPESASPYYDAMPSVKRLASEIGVEAHALVNRAAKYIATGDESHLPSMTTEQKEQLDNAFHLMLSAPVQFFEAKPQRAVRFDEFKAALVPHDDPTSAQLLREQGIKNIYHYKRDDENDRKRALSEAMDAHEDLKLSEKLQKNESKNISVEARHLRALFDPSVQISVTPDIRHNESTGDLFEVTPYNWVELASRAIFVAAGLENNLEGMFTQGDVIVTHITKSQTLDNQISDASWVTDARRIGLIDYLIDNDDRNYHNLRVGPKGLVAIGHESAMRYQDSGHDLESYLNGSRTAIAAVSDWTYDALRGLTEWWSTVSSDVRRAFAMAMVSCPEEGQKIEHSFLSRADVLDSMTRGLHLNKNTLEKDLKISADLSPHPHRENDAIHQSYKPLLRLHNPENTTDSEVLSGKPLHQKQADFEQFAASDDDSYPDDADLGGIEPKHIFRDKKNKYLVKPYSYLGVGTGWSEATSQAIYRAIGQGDLHQQSHVTYQNGSPYLVVHMDTSASKALKEMHAPSLRRIGLLDQVLGNTDRHGHNLMSKWVMPLAIDNGLSFFKDHQYATGKKKEIDQSLPHQNPTHSIAWHAAKPDAETWGWFDSKKPVINRVFESHVSAIPDDGYQKRLRESFYARQDRIHADRLAGKYGPEAVPKMAKSLDLSSPKGQKVLPSPFSKKHATYSSHEQLSSMHPPVIQDRVNKFNQFADTNPQPVRALLSGVEPKQVFVHPQKDKYLIKPFSYSGHAGGWNESTSQAIYHAIGMGDYHQKSHITVQDGNPLVVVHMADKSHTSLHDNPGQAKDRKALGRIGILDRALGNVDRHEDNLMLSGGKPLAIDNAMSFVMDHRYAAGLNAMQDATTPPKNSQAHKLGDVDSSDWQWYDSIKPKIVETFHRYADIIPDEGYRNRLKESFHARLDALDKESQSERIAKNELTELSKMIELPEKMHDTRNSNDGQLRQHRIPNMEHVQDHIDEFAEMNNSLDSFRPQNRRSKGIEPKAIFQGPKTKFIVKTVRDPSIPGVPTGWNEATSQAVYHAIGLGHLHQKSHITTDDMGSGSTVSVISVNSDATHKYFEPSHEMSLVGLLDHSLGNIDRHRHNLMMHNAKPFVIDNSRSFLFDHDSGPAYMKRMHPDMNKKNPFKSKAWRVSPPTKETWDWWDANKAKIRETVASHANYLPEQHAAKLVESFDKRQSAIDNQLRPLYEPKKKPQAISAPASTPAVAKSELAKALSLPSSITRGSAADDDMMQHKIPNMPHTEKQVKEFDDINRSSKVILPQRGKVADSGVEPKAVFHGPKTKFLVKGIYGGIPETTPIAWNEATSQAVYHAVGLGHLHQDSHITRDWSSGKTILVTHLASKATHKLNPSHEMSLVGLLDHSLGYVDRHENNLMTYNKKPLAIDNTAAFARDHAVAHGMDFWKTVPNIKNPIDSKAWDISPPTQETWDWWDANKAKIRETVASHAKHLPTGYASKLMESFDERQREVDTKLRPLYSGK